MCDPPCLAPLRACFLFLKNPGAALATLACPWLPSVAPSALLSVASRFRRFRSRPLPRAFRALSRPLRRAFGAFVRTGGATEPRLLLPVHATVDDALHLPRVWHPEERAGADAGRAAL